MGTLLAFTTVAVSVLILRYVPPDETPLPSSLQESIESVSLKYGDNIMESDSRNIQSPSSCECDDRYSHDKGDTQLVRPLIWKGPTQGNTSHLLCNGKRVWWWEACGGIYMISFFWVHFVN